MRKRIVVCVVFGALGCWAGGWVGDKFELDTLIARIGCSLAGAAIGYVLSQMLDVFSQEEEEETS